MIAVPGLEHKKEENHFNYTEDELAAKKLALKTMKELWPNVQALHAEWVYDLCKNTSEEMLKEIMHKVETTPTKFFTCNDERSPLFEEWKKQNKNM